MNPQTATPQDYLSFGRQLMNYVRTTFNEFESAAQYVSKTLYESLTDDGGKPVMALVRVYRLTTYAELSESLKAEVDPARERWITLIGTYGHEAAWRDRTQSQAHKVLNLGVDLSPMFRAALTQLEPSLRVHLSPDVESPSVSDVMDLTHQFHVEQALGNPLFPAQAGFIRPYGIQSVVGLGNGFLSGSLYLLLAFSTVSIDAAQAAAFATLAPFVGTALAKYDSKPLWK